jgi:hypothetical protein
MNGFKSWVICVVLLVLSQHGQCTDAKPAKGPLTAAEKTQCKAQLSEFNQNVNVYNAKLEVMKPLGAEIDALRVELDKEVEVVDRRDSVAMKALNDKIQKSNEMVERYEQMNSEIKAMAAESKQRAEQFSETCDNRPPAPLPKSSQTQSPDTACSSVKGAKEVQRQIDATFSQLRTDEKQHQAEVDRVAKAHAKEQSWSKERQGQFWLQLLASPKFMAFEQEKQPYMLELMRILGSKPKNGLDQCRLLQSIAATLPTIKAINARQYTFMANAIRLAK